jgi:hypothetical protein
MATTNKDFRVKHGVNVAGNGYFGGIISVADEPTQANHVATKAYVDTLANNNNTPVGPTAPSDPSNGGLWLDTVSGRLKVYYDSSWITLATGEDALTLQDHVHDTSIDGDGRIDTVFWDSSTYDDPQIAILDGGTPSSVTWDVILDGGSA